MWRYLDSIALRLIFNSVHRREVGIVSVTLGLFSLSELHAKGNCNQVEVDLNSLKRFEKDRRMTIPDELTVSKCSTKYFPGRGLNMA